MSKKDYYTYTTNESLYVAAGTVSIDIHPDHINVLDLDFNIGDLVETYQKELGIIIGVSENKNHILYHLGCRIYKIQIGDDIKDCGSLSIKKVKKPLDK
jgi:hypothetical protein|tara:strand:+ start:102 stop:398 length:297 start_codon:yes stop_codon:yes gene_type:complete